MSYSTVLGFPRRASRQSHLQGKLLARLERTGTGWADAYEHWLIKQDHETCLDHPESSPLEALSTRWKQEAARVPKRRIPVSKNCTENPLLSLKRKVHQALCLYWFFGGFPGDPSLVVERYGARASHTCAPSVRCFLSSNGQSQSVRI